MNYAETQRLRLIDTLAGQYGAVGRGVLMDYFGISRPQASADLKRYRELAPNNLKYDTTAKAYVKTQSFERVWQ